MTLRDVTVVAGLLRAVGPAGARHPRRRSRATTSRTRRFPFLTAREITVGAVPVLALRVTYVGELGWELYAPDRVRPHALDDALGGRRAARHGRRRLPGDRRAPAREGLPRLVERHHAGREPVRGGSRLRGRARQGRRLPRSRGARRGEGGRPAQAPALPRPRRPALGLPRQRAGPGRRRGRRAGSRRAATGSRSSARSRTPTCRRTAAIGTRGEVEVFGEWVGFEVAREPLWDPTGERIRS